MAADVTDNDRRVALVANGGFYVGPAVARLLAASSHDLVLGGPSAELVAEAEGLGTMDEFAAFCMPLIDGSSRFTTGQFVAYAGGWV